MPGGKERVFFFYHNRQKMEKLHHGILNVSLESWLLSPMEIKYTNMFGLLIDHCCFGGRGNIKTIVFNNI